ncbi:MAG TPA: hypothetical protein VGE41_12980, partial [Verrucomicrobiae bacterium]
SELPICKPKVKTIAAFKNGLGFVFKSGDVALQNGWARIDELPPAALGSIWLGTTSKNGAVTDVISYKDKAFTDSDAVNMPELLSANVGQRVVVTFSFGSEIKRIEGTLLAVPTDRRPEQEPVQPSQGYYPYNNIRPAEMAHGEIVLLRVATNDRPFILSLNKNAIQGLELSDGASLKTQLERDVNRIKFRVGNNLQAADMTMAYLEKGIIWSPSYRLNIEKEKSAEITLDAVLANDIEDLDNVEVSFVVGYPNFMFADFLSPLTLQQSVANFVQNLMSGVNRERNGGQRGGVMGQMVAYNTANFDTSLRPDASYAAGQPMPGETSEDLYFYRKTGVTMKKGDRARYEVFSASVPYEHLYEWEIPDSMNIDERGYHQNDGKKDPENQVWHVLRLQNTTKQPWTTAPAFTVNGAMPLAQDMLQYTPPGARNSLKLTVATDMRAEQTQVEVNRKASRIDNRNFDEVTVQGRLKITNWKDKEASLVVRKSLIGEVLSSSPEGKVTKVVKKLTSVNPNSEVEWEFQLAGGKTKEIEYVYKALIYR